MTDAGRPIDRRDDTVGDAQRAAAEAPDDAADDAAVVGPVLRQAGVWLCLRVVLTAILRRAGPAAFRAAGAERQRRTVLYVLSTAAASIATTFAIVTDGRPTRAKRHLLDSFIGYLLHDAAAVLPQWRQYPADLAHHVAVMALCGYVRTRFHALFDIAAPMMRLECSTVFLNLFWFTREFPELRARFPRAVAALPTAFLHAFFWIRVAWLPYYAWWMDRHHRRRFRGFGPVAHAGLAGLILVQFYWFAMILAKLRKAAPTAVAA